VIQQQKRTHTDRYLLDGEAVAVPMCRSVCDDVLDACGNMRRALSIDRITIVDTSFIAATFEANNQPLPNCSSLPTRKATVTLSSGKVSNYVIH